MQNEKNGFQKVVDFLIPNQHDSQKKRIQKIVTLAAIVLLIVGIVVAVLVINKYSKSKDITNSYSDMLPSSDMSSETSSDKEANTGVSSEPAAPRDPETGVIEELSEMYKANNELIGFINIPDTKLRYPVTKGADNVYYLDHTLYKEYNPFGVPFLDHRAVVVDGFESKVLTIYAHSAKDGTFFAPVKEYKDIEYYKKHPVVEFDTIYNKGKYKVVGFFMEDVRIENPKRFGYHDIIDPIEDKDIQSYIDEVAKRTYFDTGVDVNTEDQFIALSTCDTEVNNTDYRVVLVARKLRAGESAEVDTSLAKSNDDIVMPDGWVKKMGKKKPF